MFPLFPRATAVSAVLFLTTYLVRSLYAGPFREHLPVPLPSRQCSFLRRTLLVPFTPNHSANTSPVPLPSRQCSLSRRTLLVPSTLNHSANTSRCHCRFGSALSCDVPCSFPLRRTIPRTPLSCHCRLGSAPSYDVPCSFPSRQTIPRTAVSHAATGRRSRLWSAGTCSRFSPVPLPSRQCSFLRRTLFVPFTQNHSANISRCHCRLGSALSYDVPCSFPLRRTIPRTPLGATAVSAVPSLTTYLVRSLYAEPFREHLSPTPPHHVSLRVSIPSVPKGRS